ncbi:1,4-dihydroxy-2-naphthoate octaprenyltransferase [Gottfriedia solisilvae]|uniref:1,4-dihydroxy-2-naphthoate octaprenyltransferase n=2 Tax=Gottfriedia solisilvae TaxID=1516104 RepID=A0A8J3ADH4_9BACI|nr:1,4-dihydroxy-2-naphthoate polyprenyltransferase [Gottfriedia solisilvae]GGI09905.1 1,4-dihydroxy-2-naphthoate octaprenyltransferase [Gottfriedia solisilvae]
MQPTIQSPTSSTGFRTWWNLLRPHTLTAAFIPVAIGSILAHIDDSFHTLLFIAMLVASLLIQAAANMINEYYDYKRGLDHEGSVGIGGAIVRDGIKPSTVLQLAFTFFGISVLLGIYICMQSSWWIAVIGIICMTAAYLYTGGPYPIAYTPFGELVAGFFMGVVIIGITYYIQAGSVPTKILLLSLPTSITIGAILTANNIRDLDNDKENGRKTLVILLGKKNSIIFIGSMFVVAYALVVAFVIAKLMTPFVLISLLSIPLAIKATKGFIGKTEPIEMMPAMAATAKTNTIMGFLIVIGLIIGNILS